MTTLPSRRYTCAECGRKGRRNNSPDERRRAPVCPSCERQCPRCRDLAEAIVSTLEENRHLADGENCTLAKLKTVVPNWK